MTATIPMTNDAERVSDIVAELRDHEGDYHLPPGLLAKAADIIEAQSKALAEARAALTLCADFMAQTNALMKKIRTSARAGGVITDVPYREIGELMTAAHAGELTARAALTPTPENPNG